MATISTSSPIEKLALRGLKAMDEAPGAEKERSAAADVLDQADLSTASPTERAVIETARDIRDLTLRDESAAAAQRIALKALADQWNGTVPEVLARMGGKMIAQARDDEDARAIGGMVLERIAEPLAKAADRATSGELYDASAAAAHRIAFDLIASPPAGVSAAALMARFGRQAAAAAVDDEDARAIGSEVLAAIADGGGAEGEFAADVDEITGQSLCDESARAAQRDALAVLQHPLAGTPESRLADFGIRASGQAADAEDTYCIADATLARIAGRTWWDSVRALAERGRSQADAAETWWEGSDIHRTSLDEIRRFANSNPAVGADARREILGTRLEESIAKRRSEIAQAKSELQASRARVQALDVELGQVQHELEPVDALNLQAMRKLKVGGMMTTGGLIAALGGIVASAIAPIAPAVSWTVAGAGAIAAGGGMYLVRKSSDERGAAMSQQIRITAKLFALSAERDSLAAGQGRRQAAVDALEEMVCRDQSQLDVLRMADAVNRKPESGNVQMGQETVTIGGVTVPRKA